jgi:hypothetical protein
MTQLGVNGYVVNATADYDNPFAPVDLVISRFDTTLAKAEEMYEMLIGPDGESGLLGDMQASIENAPTISIIAPTVDTSLVLENSGQVLPTFDTGLLLPYPVDEVDAPTIASLPSINVSFGTVTAPDDVNPVFSWAESVLPVEIYNALRERLLADLDTDVTALDTAVEEALYQRARNKQQQDRLAEWNRINNTAAQMQFALPSGVLASGLADFGIGATRQDADIESTIIVTRADVAIKNGEIALKHREATMQQAAALEEMIRRTHTDSSGRSLEYAKTLVADVRENFKMKLEKYIAESSATVERDKVAIQAQVETLRGVIESNKGLVDVFKSEMDAFKTRTEGITSHNKGQTEVYIGQVQGFSEAERAVASRNASAIQALSERIKAADMQLRAAISTAEQTVAGYNSEMSVKEKMSSDMANIAAQVVASMLSAVHAGATLGYSGSESSSKSYSLGNSLSENHSYEHDPTA